MKNVLLVGFATLFVAGAVGAQEKPVAPTPATTTVKCQGYKVDAKGACVPGVADKAKGEKDCEKKTAAECPKPAPAK